jgi:hypothetical protein
LQATRRQNVHQGLDSLSQSGSRQRFGAGSAADADRLGESWSGNFLPHLIECLLTLPKDGFLDTFLQDGAVSISSQLSRSQLGIWQLGVGRQ